MRDIYYQGEDTLNKERLPDTSNCALNYAPPFGPIRFYAFTGLLFLSALLAALSVLLSRTAPICAPFVALWFVVWMSQPFDQRWWNKPTLRDLATMIVWFGYFALAIYFVGAIIVGPTFMLHNWLVPMQPTVVILVGLAWGLLAFFFGLSIPHVLFASSTGFLALLFLRLVQSPIVPRFNVAALLALLVAVVVANGIVRHRVAILLTNPRLHPDVVKRWTRVSSFRIQFTSPSFITAAVSMLTLSCIGTWLIFRVDLKSPTLPLDLSRSVLLMTGMLVALSLVIACFLRTCFEIQSSSVARRFDISAIMEM